MSRPAHALEKSDHARLPPGMAPVRRPLQARPAPLPAAYRERGNPAESLKRRAALVDRVLRTVWHASGMAADLALVAVGGYGRGTLFPYSDVDVLILLPDAVDDERKDSVSQLVSR